LNTTSPPLLLSNTLLTRLPTRLSARLSVCLPTCPAGAIRLEEVLEVRTRRQSMVRRIHKDVVTKQMRAEELRLEHLDEKRRKAQEEDEKTKEIQFIQRLEGHNARLELEDRRRSKEQRVEQLEQDRQRRNAEKAARDKAVLARRVAKEQERLRIAQVRSTPERSERAGKRQNKKRAGDHRTDEPPPLQAQQTPDLVVCGTALPTPTEVVAEDPATKQRQIALKKRLKKVKHRMAKRAVPALQDAPPDLDPKVARLLARLSVAIGSSAAGEKTIIKAVSECVRCCVGFTPCPPA